MLYYQLLLILILLSIYSVQGDNIEINNDGESLGNYIKRRQRSKNNNNKIEISSTKDCLPCPIDKNENYYDLAVMYYWKSQEDNNNSLFLLAYGCACNGLKINEEDRILKAIASDIAKNYVSISNNEISIPNTDAGTLKNWQILGPLPVGKLELDGDPTFTLLSKSSNNYNKSSERLLMNAGLHILALPNNLTVYSELMQGGKVNWRKVAAGKNIVEVRFSVSWNELVQGVSTLGAYEFQGWARTITYVTSKSPYLLQCPGVHTVFVRNKGMTRLLTGDIYQGGLISNVIELSPGPVGIAIPLRGAAMMSFSCTLTKIKSSVRVLSLTHGNTYNYLSYL